MLISQIKIRNFRRLKSISIDLTEDKTIFVGANNSGKTSAMLAMRYFLIPNEQKMLNVHDFTLSNHSKINKIGNDWVEKEDVLDLSRWKDILPSLDLWFDVKDEDIHYVSHILPTLDWVGGDLGICLRYEPKELKKFHQEYKLAKEQAINTKNEANAGEDTYEVELWPKNMMDFLEKSLSEYFEIKFYILDPTKKQNDTVILGEPLEKNPLLGLIQIDEINAQRGLSDDGNESSGGQNKLSQQLTSYYEKHIDPFKEPTLEDIKALDAIDKAHKEFDSSLKIGFETTFKELEILGYPGFYNPNLKISTKINPANVVNHPSALQYELDGCKNSFLPEHYNGLGYQNLIFMAFKLIRFRDFWLKIGKQKSNISSASTAIEYPPIHLVLIEEPEAHLHPQAQQVFINQAYKILRNREEVKTSNLATQLVVTTHSSHITHECEFSSLRYFKRTLPDMDGEVQSTEVINLSNVFGTDNDTSRFVTRYIKPAHCDLFFADASIIIEGDAERILLPHFINRAGFEYLNQSYISILNIGGSHAYTLKPLIETLGIATLIITDLDSTSDGKSVPVARNRNQKTANNTLKKWVPKRDSIDDLLDLEETDKETNGGTSLRVAYQKPLLMNGEEVLPYTFEDTLFFENMSVFKGLQGQKGTIKKFQDILGQADLSGEAYKIIRSDGFKKAEFALDLLLCLKNFDEINIPTYIKEGLSWLEEHLKNKLVKNFLTEKAKEGFNGK